MTDVAFKLRVLRTLTDTLKEITPDNGYVSDLADFNPGDGHAKSRVFRGRAWFGESDELPLVSLLESVNPGDEVNEPKVTGSAGEYDWDIIIQGFVDDDDPENPTDSAYVLLADVRRRLAVEMSRKFAGTNQPDPLGIGLGRNRITKLTVGPGVVRPADDVSSKSYFWLTVRLRIVDNPSEPFL